MSSWRGAQLNVGTTLPLTLTLHKGREINMFMDVTEISVLSHVF
jgi:hypothetical protein